MNQTETTVWKTLAYHCAIGGMPITLTEIQRYLVTNEGDNWRSQYYPLFLIYNALEKLIGEGLVTLNSGFYSISNCSKDGREKRYMKETQIKRKRAGKQAKFLIYIPYVKGVYLIGSVGRGNAKEDSDLDVLIESKKGRIWSSRVLVSFFSHISGVRRNDKKVNNRLCFNQFISTETVSYGPSVGVQDIHKIIKTTKLSLANEDPALKNHSIQFQGHIIPLIFAKHAVEWVLDKSKIGDLFEKAAAQLQIKKIRGNEVPYPESYYTLGKNTNNITFYFPRVKEIEEKYNKIVNNVFGQSGQFGHTSGQFGHTSGHKFGQIDNTSGQFGQNLANLSTSFPLDHNR